MLVDGWADPTPALVERIAEVDDALLEAYLEGQMPSVEALRAATLLRCEGSYGDGLGNLRVLNLESNQLRCEGLEALMPMPAVDACVQREVAQCADPFHTGAAKAAALAEEIRALI